MSKPTINELQNQVDTHEAVCAERWLETIHRIKRLENIMLASTGAVVMTLIAVLLAK